MKFHVKSLIAIVCLMLPLAALASSASTCRAHGQSSFHAWSHGQYTRAAAHFSPAVAARLTPQKLQKLWKMLETKVGKFKALGKFESRTVAGHAVEVAPMTFGVARLAAVFSCDAKGRLASWALLNPARVPGLLPPAPAKTSGAKH